MKNMDNVPIFIVIAALFINIAIGVKNHIGFSELMIRCIVVTIIFGIFGYMLTETLKRAIECSRLSKLVPKKEEAAAVDGSYGKEENKPTFDFKVPPLDDKELMDLNNDSDDGFVEVNPVQMKDYDRDEQD